MTKIKRKYNAEEKSLKRSSYRVPAGIASQILSHPQKRQYAFYLELKTLFVNGIIYNEGSKRPITRIAEILKVHPETARIKINQLQRLKLIQFDQAKNLHLAAFSVMAQHFGTSAKKKHTIEQSPDTYYKGEYSADKSGTMQRKQKYVRTALQAIQYAAIKENLKRQEWITKQKLIDSQIKNIIAERFINNLNATKTSGCRSVQTELATMSKGERRKLAKCFDVNVLMADRMKVWEAEVQQISYATPEINPNITLSLKGTARVCGGGSISRGHKLQQRLARAKLISVARDIMPIAETSPAIYEAGQRLRTDVFKTTAPLMPGRQRYHYLRLPNAITLHS